MGELVGGRVEAKVYHKVVVDFQDCLKEGQWAQMKF